MGHFRAHPVPWQDEPAQVGKDQETKALAEMNELQEFENDILSPGRG